VTDELDAKLARVTDSITGRNSQRAVTARDELEAIGFLAEAGHLRKRLGTQKFWLRTPRFEFGDPIFNGCDLSKPGIVPPERVPPKAKVRDAAGPQGSHAARTAKGRDPSDESGSGELLGGGE
jgi:hypothetical protein